MNMRMTRRGAGILIALMLIAVPAAAAVMTQNFQSATIDINGPCFDVTAGNDASSPTNFVQFATATVSTGSIDLRQESLTVAGHVGNRAIYSEVARFANGCGADASVEFFPINDPSGTPAFVPDLTDPVWDDFTISFYLANGIVVDGATRALAVVIDSDANTTLPIATDPVLRWTAQILYP